MAKTTFYFIRHGETEYNRKRIVQGRRINASLNETGREQAEALARRFAGTPVDVIFSSTLRRAEETARAIAKHHPAVPHYRLRDLEEISWGIYEGQTLTAEVAEALDNMSNRWQRGEYHFAVEEGESILACQQRALRAVAHILKDHAGKNIVVVTHGRFLRVLLASVLSEFGLDRMQDIQHANTSVNHLIHEKGEFRAALLNCTSHLDHVETIMIE